MMAKTKTKPMEKVEFLQPREGSVEMEKIDIIGYIDAKSEPTLSYSLMSLKPEGRRVIESFPVLEIPGFMGRP